MNIIHLSPVFLPYASGMTNVVVEQTRELARRGHNVQVITPRYIKEWSKKEIIDGLQVTRITPWLQLGNGAFVPQMLGELMRMINANDANEKTVVHVHAPFFGGIETVWLMKKLGLLRGIKLVVQYHHDPQLRGFTKLLSIPSKIIFGSLIRSADVVVVSSLEYAKGSAIGEYRTKALVEIPLGVDMKRFMIINLPLTTNDKNKPINILFVGALDKAHHFKGVDILLKAFKNVLNHSSKVKSQLSIVGKGDLLEDYKKLAQELNVSDSVIFHGFVPDEELDKMRMQSDIAVFPSTGKAEAFGLVALEAMAAGLPVIASNLPGVRTLFANDQLITEPGDGNDLAEKISLLLNNPELRITIGKQNRERVLEHYTWEKVVDELEEEYNRNP